jgi:hypothetical protein
VKNLTWQNPGQLFVAQELIKIVKLKCCGIKDPIIWIISWRIQTKCVNLQFVIKNDILINYYYQYQLKIKKIVTIL